MKPIPISEAKRFCEDYEKDQAIIISWDRESGDTWVTTYGKSDADSAMAAHGGNMIKDFLKLKRDSDEIPDRFKKWEIEIVDRFYYYSGRFSKTYMEITYWYDAITLDRKETVRKEYLNDGDEWKLPDWAKTCKYNPNLNYDR